MLKSDEKKKNALLVDNLTPKKYGTMKAADLEAYKNLLKVENINNNTYIPITVTSTLTHTND